MAPANAQRVFGVAAAIILVACSSDSGSGEEGSPQATDPAPVSSGPSPAAAPTIEHLVPRWPFDASGYPSDDPNEPGTGALSVDLAQHVAVAEIAAYQSVKVSLAKAGAPVARTEWPNIWGNVPAEVPIVAGRDALLRVFVTPDAAYTPTPVTARVKLQRKAPQGVESHVLFATKTVTAASNDADLSSTINVTIPGALLEAGATFGVVLNTPGKRPAPSGTSPARYPTDGSLADLGASAFGDVMKVVLVPLRYNGDGSGRMPDTSDAQVALYRDQLFRKYPVVKVDVSVHAPVDYDSVVTHDNGMSDILNFTSQLRDKDAPPSNVYYAGLLKPADDFWSFCGSGCVAGLSWVGSPVSVWWGYSGTDWAGGTGAHELGHAHGLPHAPCGTTDPDYWPSDADHENAKLGAWGWDPVDKKLFDPSGSADPSVKTTYRDVMSYCGPTWIGDFNYAKLWHRVKSDNGAPAGTAPVTAPPPAAMQGIVIGASGGIWEKAPVAYRPWMEHAARRTVVVVGADGRDTARDAYFFPYDHLPGGRLLVAEEHVRNARAVRVDSLVVPRR